MKVNRLFAAAYLALILAHPAYSTEYSFELRDYISPGKPSDFAWKIWEAVEFINPDDCPGPCPDTPDDPVTVEQTAQSLVVQFNFVPDDPSVYDHTQYVTTYDEYIVFQDPSGGLVGDDYLRIEFANGGANADSTMIISLLSAMPMGSSLLGTIPTVLDAVYYFGSNEELPPNVDIPFGGPIPSISESTALDIVDPFRLPTSLSVIPARVPSPTTLALAVAGFLSLRALRVRKPTQRGQVEHS